MLYSEKLSYGIQKTLTSLDKLAAGTKGILNGLPDLH